MPSEFRTTRRVEFADTDMAGIIHFTAFFRYMEEAEHAFLRSLGLSVVMQVDGERIGWPRVAASCSFLRPVRFEDVLDVHLRVAEKGEKSVTYTCVFSKDGQEIARGQITTVCCRLGPDGQPKSIPIPPLFGDKLEPAPAAPGR
ncbi:MAG: acyl-CoA thioesterase [Planctomycetes bacterium]|nr:acyl-CoA thioesterase [Planctomycetota bacterium]